MYQLSELMFSLWLTIVTYSGFHLILIYLNLFFCTSYELDISVKAQIDLELSELAPTILYVISTSYLA